MALFLPSFSAVVCVQAGRKIKHSVSGGPQGGFFLWASSGGLSGSVHFHKINLPLGWHVKQLKCHLIDNNRTNVAGGSAGCL